MDIRDDRHIAAARAQSRDDMLKIGCVLHRRSGDAHDLAADLGQLDASGAIDASVSIVSQVIIDWTRTGLAPPTPTRPTITSRDRRRS